MRDAPDADPGPVPHRREEHGTGGGTTTSQVEASPASVRFEGNRASEHPPAATPARGRWWRPVLSWAVIVLMLVAAGVLFWAPWRTDSAGPLQAGADAGPAVAGEPSPGAGAGAAAPAGDSARVVHGPIVPTRIVIPAMGVDTTVEHRGTVREKNAFTGQTVEAFGVPTSMRTTSWWSDGPQPGSGQMAVVLGHTQVGGDGVFDTLAKLHSGDAVSLQAANGDTLRLAVVGNPVTGLRKSTSALADALNRHPAGVDLALVTCGGPFDQAANASQDNIVVFASVLKG